MDAILDQHIQALGITPAMPTEQLAIAITGLLSGLGVEELAKPGLVPDELFGQTIELLLRTRATELTQLRRARCDGPS